MKFHYLNFPKIQALFSLLLETTNKYYHINAIGKTEREYLLYIFARLENTHTFFLVFRVFGLFLLFFLHNLRSRRCYQPFMCRF